MSVPAIALYATPPSSIYSPEHDLNPNPRLPLSSSPPIAGGLSCLFSRHSAAASVSSGGDDVTSFRSDELSSSFSFKSLREQSPVSVLHFPASSRSSATRKDHIFKGFVTNALGSCVDFSPPSSVDADELTFELDEDLDEEMSELDSYSRDLITRAQSRYRVFHEELVVKAFYEAEKAHRGQMRASGDPYLLHCVETAELLAKIGANATVVAAGLLHDTLDDSFMDYDYVFKNFGAGVADLVEGVSKLSQLSKLARDNDTANKTEEADRLHTMFLAMADARAVLIKLADRLHNMMTLEALPTLKQQRFAKETLEIFAPLANRLGIFTWKEQLENLCFKYISPEQFNELSSKLVKCFDEEMISSAIEKLEKALKDEGISYHVVSGRHKSLYSIHSKMLKKKLSMDEIHDIHGLRLIVEKEEDCYAALNVVHRLWPKVLGRLKDYIVRPKFNGYQSLHTVVVGEDTLPLEVQIRTKQMHLQAEFGFAAHWRYKEGDNKHSSFVLQMVEWARWIVTWQCETLSTGNPLSKGDTNSIKPPCPFPSHAEDCPHSYTRQCDHDGPIFIILLENDKMSVQEFPRNSTVTDLLERVGRGCTRWNPCTIPMKEELRPRLNHEPINECDQLLKMGDVVELTPAIPDKSLVEYREEIKRMYDKGKGFAVAASSRKWSSHG